MPVLPVRMWRRPSALSMCAWQLPSLGIRNSGVHAAASPRIPSSMGQPRLVHATSHLTGLLTPRCCHSSIWPAQAVCGPTATRAGLLAQHASSPPHVRALQHHILPVPCRQPFAAASEQHLAALTAQLLASQQVPDVAIWCPIITCLALGAAAAVSPTAMAAQGNQDPAFYIKVPPVQAAGCLLLNFVWLGVCAHLPARAGTAD